jgi:hypothetical protein
MRQAKRRYKMQTVVKKSAKGAHTYSTIEAVAVADLKVARETEKAIAVLGGVVCGGREKDVTVWLPKSVIKNGLVPVWILGKKREELAPSGGRLFLAGVDGFAF